MVKGLLVMDVDSTLIKEEVIDLLGETYGVGQEIANITELAMQGHLNFEQSLKERVKLLKGMSTSSFDHILSHIHINDGAKELIDYLHENDYKVGLVSGGFHEIVNIIARNLKIDFVKANHFEIANGKLTGNLEGEIVTPNLKKTMLIKWRDSLSIDKEKTVAMGDGANDILMIKEAGTGIAFMAKPALKEVADTEINSGKLSDLIPIIKKKIDDD